MSNSEEREKMNTDIKTSISELASELNKSTSQWLNAHHKATDILATEEDIMAFLQLVSEKRQAAEELSALVVELYKQAIS